MKHPSYLLFVVIFILLCIEPSNASIQTNENGCTIGVASGKATSDGRPLLWKTRDALGNNNAVYYDTSMKYKFIAVVTPGALEYCWMGVNEKGFSIINAYAPDLPGSYEDNCSLMKDAIGTCTTVSDFQSLLDDTNITGRRTQSNYGVIDSTGAAIIFETCNTSYWKFDANDTTIAPKGYIIRTNFSINGGGEGGIERYVRSSKLISNFYSGDSLNHKSILRYQMRDFSDNLSQPLSIPYDDKLFTDTPYGFICTSKSICGGSSVSAAVIQGVLPGESPKLSTMWTILGQPATTIAVPYWPIGKTPTVSYRSPISSLCDLAIKLREELFEVIYVSLIQSNCDFIDTYKLKYENGLGLWSKTFPAEDSIFIAAENLLDKWRGDTLNIKEMLDNEYTFADFSHSIIQEAYDDFTAIAFTDEPMANSFALYQNYPNPFNSNTIITYNIYLNCMVTLSVYNSIGQNIATLVSQEQPSGTYKVEWNAMNKASDIYFYKIEAGNYQQVRKMLLVK